MNKLKKTISLLLSLVIVLSVFSLLSITANAEAPSGNFITFSSPNSFTVTISTNFDGGMQYLNNFTTNVWNSVATETTFTAARIGDTGDYYLCFRGIHNKNISTDQSGNFSDNWKINGSFVACSGNIETLLDYATVARGEHPIMNVFCFKNMFRNCTALTSAPELPAMELTSECYAYMFFGCTNLTAVPTLPATNLADYCYVAMFHGCTKLTAVPALPATSMFSYSYGDMFNGCSGIKLYTSASEVGSPCAVWSIPAGAVGYSNWAFCMFTNTGGNFTGTPEIGVPYYYPNPMFGSKDFNLTGTYNEGEAPDTVYSVSLTWGAMDFTYTTASQGVWNPTAMRYEDATEASWTCEAEANIITVKNRSNAAINAGFAFTPEEGIVGGFYDATSGGNEIVGNAFALTSAIPTGGDTVGTEQIGTAYLHITSGSLTSGQTAVKIGRITVTITD